VSMPIAVMLVPSVSRYDGHGPDGQQCVQEKTRSYEVGPV
jgi:hypothetical protein